ncbi:MAG: hypothetical protein V3V96_15440 [Acidiferrobacterales bacterium]
MMVDIRVEQLAEDMATAEYTAAVFALRKVERTTAAAITAILNRKHLFLGQHAGTANPDHQPGQAIMQAAVRELAIAFREASPHLVAMGKGK